MCAPACVQQSTHHHDKEVVMECWRQEVRVQECVGTAVSEEMSRSDERLHERDAEGSKGAARSDAEGVERGDGESAKSDGE